MTSVIIAGYRYTDTPTFSFINGERRVTVAVPYDTPKNVLIELEEATDLQVTDPLGREIIGLHRLIGWRSITTLFGKNNEMKYLIAWAVPDLDETEALKKQVEDLKTENEDLIEVILELASYIGGGIPEEEMNL